MRNGRLIERCKIPDKDKNKQVVKMLNTRSRQFGDRHWSFSRPESPLRNFSPSRFS